MSWVEDFSNFGDFRTTFTNTLGDGYLYVPMFANYSGVGLCGLVLDNTTNTEHFQLKNLEGNFNHWTIASYVENVTEGIYINGSVYVGVTERTVYQGVTRFFYVWKINPQGKSKSTVYTGDGENTGTWYLGSCMAPNKSVLFFAYWDAVNKAVKVIKVDPSDDSASLIITESYNGLTVMDIGADDTYVYIGTTSATFSGLKRFAHDGSGETNRISGKNVQFVGPYGFWLDDSNNRVYKDNDSSNYFELSANGTDTFLGGTLLTHASPWEVIVRTKTAGATANYQVRHLSWNETGYATTVRWSSDVSTVSDLAGQDFTTLGLAPMEGTMSPYEVAWWNETSAGNYTWHVWNAPYKGVE